MTFQRVQVSIVNWVIVSVVGGATIFGTMGCQTTSESTPRVTSAAGGTSSANLNVPPLRPTEQKTGATQPLASKTSRPSVSTAPATRRLSPARQPAPAAARTQPASDSELLRGRVTEGRVVLVSSDQIVAVPGRNAGTRNNPPSLMEDAIATSAIQTRINSNPALRAAGVKCRTSAGVVTIRGGELSVAQQAAVLNAALREQNVREVRLVLN